MVVSLFSGIFLYGQTKHRNRDLNSELVPYHLPSFRRLALNRPVCWTTHWMLALRACAANMGWIAVPSIGGCRDWWFSTLSIFRRFHWLGELNCKRSQLSLHWADSASRSDNVDKHSTNHMSATKLYGFMLKFATENYELQIVARVTQYQFGLLTDCVPKKRSRAEKNETSKVIVRNVAKSFTCFAVLHNFSFSSTKGKRTHSWPRFAFWVPFIGAVS